MNPYVAVCIPSMSTWQAKTSMASIGLCLHAMQNKVLGCILNEESSLISLARNNLVRRALAYSDNISHILWIDSDTVFPQDALSRLLAHGQDIVGCRYRARVEPHGLVGKLTGPKFGALQKAERLPGGFMLVKSYVYAALESPWYSESYNEADKTELNVDGLVGEDTGFCRKVISAGFDVWCDTSLEIQHIGDRVFPGEGRTFKA